MKNKLEKKNQKTKRKVRDFFYRHPDCLFLKKEIAELEEELELQKEDLIDLVAEYDVLDDEVIIEELLHRLPLQSLDDFHSFEAGNFTDFGLPYLLARTQLREEIGLSNQALLELDQKILTKEIELLQVKISLLEEKLT